jgi:hypothetical protein
LAIRLIGLCLVACCLSTPVAAQAVGERIPQPVRSTTRWGLNLIQDGYRQSPSFRGLVEGISDTDVIVYVEPARELPGTMVAVTELIGKTDRARYLRIWVGIRAMRKRLIALLGHELQHVLEIGRAPQVVDQATLAAFYRKAGDISADGYDTQAARNMGDTVYDELWRRPQPAGSATPAGPASPALVPSASIYVDLTRW